MTSAAIQNTGALTGRRPQNRGFGDRAFRWFTLLMALVVFVLIILIALELAGGSVLSLKKFGWRFLVSREWDPVSQKFGALPCIFGTLVSSAIALVIAVPLSIATAVFLTELAPLWIRQPLSIFIELLAAVPSVILGLWGFLIMAPWLGHHLYPSLKGTFSYLAVFTGPISPYSMLSAGIILAIMIVPIITSVSREILRSVPGLQREAAYALGATRWEVTRLAVLSYARRGLFGAVILGLARALGETMAVTMVIGNSYKISSSLFAPGCTLASWVANQFAEASGDVYYSALLELGLVLLGVTVLVNAFAQLFLKAFAGPGVQPQH
jgi:phosphate transport system permease protein